MSLPAMTLTTVNNLVKQLPIPTALLDADFKLVHASHSWLEHFDCTKGQYFGKCISQLPQFIESQVLAQLKFCMEGTPQKLLFDTQTSNTQYKNYQFTCTPLYNENENIIGIILQAEDISHYLENEVRFEKLENLLKDQSEMSKVGTWEYHIATQELSWSKMTKKIHDVPENYQPNVDTAIDFYTCGHERNTIAMFFHNGMTKGQSWTTKSKMKTAKGKEKWVISSGKPIIRDNKIIRLVGTFQDITEQEKAEQQIREREQILHTLIDNIPLNIYIKDLNLKKILVNKAECDFLGVPNAQELLGKSDDDFFDKEMATKLRDEDLEVIFSEKPIFSQERILPNKTGKEIPMLVSKIPLKNLGGQIYALLGIGMDISSLKEKENQLRKLINVTSEQNKKLINFAHIVSHNLRSHTANFSMLLEFLMQEKDDTEKEQLVTMLSQAAQNLMETLENLNIVVDINANTDMEQEHLDLSKKIQQSVRVLDAYLKQKRAKIITNIPPGTTIKAAPAYLDNIILNILKNAMIYSHPDRPPVITLNAKKEGGTTVLSIQDNGLGIDLDKYGKKLFGMYKTFHNNKDSRGIGLFIVKTQVEAMGGTIDAQSQVGVGSTFNIRLHD